MVRVRKVALMGFPAVGKSSLAYQYVENRFEDEYITTIENQLEKDIKIGDRDFRLQIYDTMGVTELPNFPDDYLIMDGWIIVYSVAESRSFDVVREIYERLMAAGAQGCVKAKFCLACHLRSCAGRPSPAHHPPFSTRSPPVIIVANKCDLVEDRVISMAEGKALAEKCGALYVESSARDNTGVTEVFHRMITEIERRNGDPIKAEKDCIIL
ncbi:uncharacterized protein MONBRDRAFT_36472 [Monosiga brevicollis MX1]|uniref:Uncharacterized protein n=1 Tax=Monosiga brevicollis TaxID=81824 RepID=A9UVE7_MONBE|nr:uncharacterized protein MONBRDRAFT_36472 [Monosiga brevicollis MX1]EDQ90387.1 predicted protein [Monosiga brevicollis MX1]|eukprot:XP_001744438.1 hypothetical protein [Monosiga brevicollis MX1]